MMPLPFAQPDQIDAIAYRLITKNDDSGRHGVLMPREAYALFPSFEGFRDDVEENYTADITTIWPQFGNIERQSKWKHYHRYPERRVTSLGSTELNDAPPGTMVIFGRLGAHSGRYEVLLLPPGHPVYRAILDAFGVTTDAVAPGNYGVDLKWIGHPQPPQGSVALLEFLKRFDAIKALGPVQSGRPGPTGVGFTLESLLGIAPNNQPTGDFMGMEVKAFRSADTRARASGRHNLFLKEPRWCDGLAAPARIRRYGYPDADRGHALYVTVSSIPNAQSLALRFDRPAQVVELTRSGGAVGDWTAAVLEQRLRQKLHETVFIDAAPTRVGDVEHFHYWGITYCTSPSVEALTQLITEGEVVVELRMRAEESGRIRNHGTAFRVRVPSLSRLFARSVRIRS